MPSFYVDFKLLIKNVISLGGKNLPVLLPLSTQSLAGFHLHNLILDLYLTVELK